MKLFYVVPEDAIAEGRFVTAEDEHAAMDAFLVKCDDWEDGDLFVVDINSMSLDSPKVHDVMDHILVFPV